MDETRLETFPRFASLREHSGCIIVRRIQSAYERSALDRNNERDEFSDNYSIVNIARFAR